MKWQEIRDKVAKEAGVDFITVQKVFKALRVIAQSAGAAAVFKFVGYIMDIEDDE